MATEDKDLGESANTTREVHNAVPEQDLVHTASYSVFTKTEKWIIVAMASNAAWFSTLSSFIYYPAIPALSKSLNESVGRINLTITTYMAIASIAPALVGDAADILGRRPVYILTLSVYFVANIAIALTKSYASLLGLRVLQALAVSGKMDHKRTLPVTMGLMINRDFLYCLWGGYGCCISRRKGVVRCIGLIRVSVPS